MLWRLRWRRPNARVMPGRARSRGSASPARALTAAPRVGRQRISSRQSAGVAQRHGGTLGTAGSCWHQTAVASRGSSHVSRAVNCWRLPSPKGAGRRCSAVVKFQVRRAGLACWLPQFGLC